MLFRGQATITPGRVYHADVFTKLQERHPDIVLTPTSYSDTLYMSAASLKGWVRLTIDDFDYGCAFNFHFIYEERGDIMTGFYGFAEFNE
jgi:hypothetical protein